MQKSCTYKGYGLLSLELQILPNACVLQTVYLHQKAVNAMRTDVHCLECLKAMPSKHNTKCGDRKFGT